MENNSTTKQNAFLCQQILTKIERYIGNIAEDLKKHIVNRHRFTTQLAESTDISNVFELMVFAGSCFSNDMHEELLFSEPLRARYPGEVIFSTANYFFNKNNVLWKK